MTATFRAGRTSSATSHQVMLPNVPKGYGDLLVVIVAGKTWPSTWSPSDPPYRVAQRVREDDPTIPNGIWNGIYRDSGLAYNVSNFYWYSFSASELPTSNCAWFAKVIFGDEGYTGTDDFVWCDTLIRQTYPDSLVPFDCVLEYQVAHIPFADMNPTLYNGVADPTYRMFSKGAAFDYPSDGKLLMQLDSSPYDIFSDALYIGQGVRSIIGDDTAAITPEVRLLDPAWPGTLGAVDPNWTFVNNQGESGDYAPITTMWRWVKPGEGDDGFNGLDTRWIPSTPDDIYGQAFVGEVAINMKPIPEGGPAVLFVPLDFDLLELADADERGWVEVRTLYAAHLTTRATIGALQLRILVGHPDTPGGTTYTDYAGILIDNGSTFGRCHRSQAVSSVGDGTAADFDTWTHYTAHAYIRLSRTQLKVETRPEDLYGYDYATYGSVFVFPQPIDFACDHLIFDLRNAGAAGEKSTLEVHSIDISSTAFDEYGSDASSVASGSGG